MINLFNDHFKIRLIILFFTGWFILKLRTVCLRCYFQVGYYRLLMIYCVFHILYQGSGHLHKQILVKGQSSEIFTSNFFSCMGSSQVPYLIFGSFKDFMFWGVWNVFVLLFMAESRVVSGHVSGFFYLRVIRKWPQVQKYA
jgi:hypothetical protein